MDGSSEEGRKVVKKKPFFSFLSLSSLQPHTCQERGAWIVLPPFPAAASGAAAEEAALLFLALEALAAPSASSASSKEGGKPVATIVTCSSPSYASSTTCFDAFFFVAFRFDRTERERCVREREGVEEGVLWH